MACGQINTLLLTGLYEWKVSGREVNDMAENSAITSPKFSGCLFDGDFYYCQMVLHKKKDGKLNCNLKLISCGTYENISIRFSTSFLGCEQKSEKIAAVPGNEMESKELLGSAQEVLNTFIVKCFVELFDAKKKLARDTKQSNKEFLSEMEKLSVHSKDLTDVTLSIRDKKLKVHKAVLAARSPVFAKMFDRDANMDSVNIPDLYYDVIEEMVNFIYKGKISENQPVTDVLLNAAQKYAISGLIDEYSNMLDDQLTVENAVDTLLTAYKYSMIELKEATRRFISFNLKKVMATEKWKKLTAERTDIVSDLFCALLKYRE